MSSKETGKSKTSTETDQSESLNTEGSTSTFFDRVSDATSSAFKFAKKTGGTSYKVGKAIN